MPLPLHLLFWGMLLTVALFISFDRELRVALRKHWWAVCLFLLLAFFWRLPLQGRFFHGLEYEDAYVYAVAGRYLSEGVSPDSSTNARYLTSVCAVGSWRDCEVFDTFSGHLIGYPYLIALVSGSFGYSSEISSYVSLTASLLTLVAIFLVGRLADPKGVTGDAAAFLFAVTPVFAVQGVATYSEPLSNFFVVLILLLFLSMVRQEHDTAALLLTANWAALTFTGLFAIVVKRENLLVIPVMTLTWLISSGKTAFGTKLKHAIALIFSSCLCLVFAYGELQFSTILQSETGEFGMFPFGWDLLKSMFPLFVSSYLSPRWYLWGCFFLIIGLATGVRAKRLTVLPAMLFVSFLFLYSAHVRSYYQLQSGDVTAFDTIRYSINMAALWAILAGVGVSHLYEMLSRRHGVYTHKALVTLAVLLATGAYALSGLVSTERLRREMVDDELSVRIRPAQSVLELMSQTNSGDAFVVTPEPLLIHMLALRPVNVIDLRYVSEALLRRIQDQRPQRTFLYLEEATYLSKTEERRHQQSYDFLKTVKKIEVKAGEGYRIYKLELDNRAAGR